MLTLVGVIPIACTQTAFSQAPPFNWKQKQILTCDHPGYPSCYSTGYATGLAHPGIDCSGLLLNSFGIYISTTQVDNYCSGFRAAQQQQQQQQK